MVVWFSIPVQRTSDGPEHDKTNNLSSDHSDSLSEHLPSLIEVLAIRLKKQWVLRYHKAHSEDYGQSLHWDHVIFFFFFFVVVVVFLFWFCRAPAQMINAITKLIFSLQQLAKY